MAQEIELKRLLTVRGYADLRAHLDSLTPARIAAQDNRYLDTQDGQLHAHGAMLRLRVVGDRLTLTLKARANVHAGVLQALELERDLTDPDEQRFWLRPRLQWPDVAAQLGDWLAQAGLVQGQGELVVIGATANERRIYRLAGGVPSFAGPLTLELDRTQYPGGVERLELECEHADAHVLAPALDAWLAALGVVATAATETKYAQFLRLTGRARG